MPSRESYVVKRGKKKSRRKAEKETGQKGSLFTAALGLNVSAGSIPSLPVSGGTAAGSGTHRLAPSKPSSLFPCLIIDQPRPYFDPQKIG